MAGLDGLERVALDGGLEVRVARRRRDRRVGLSKLAELDPGTGLWILRCRSVHTFGMAFALDLVWLDRGDAVIAVDRDVGPNRLRTNLRARTVIEVAAGRGAAFADVWPRR